MFTIEFVIFVLVCGSLVFAKRLEARLKRIETSLESLIDQKDDVTLDPSDERKLKIMRELKKIHG